MWRARTFLCMPVHVLGLRQAELVLRVGGGGGEGGEVHGITGPAGRE